MIDNNISFGLQKKSSFIFGTGKIGSVYPINSYEKIVTTNKEFLKIENTTIKKSYNCQFSTSLFIEEANLIVGVSAQKSELFVFTLNDISNPIIANFPTNQLGVFHIIYSKKSSVLLTFGFGVKVWNFSIKLPDRRRSTLKPSINISLRYSFSGDDSTTIVSPEVSSYESSILIPPSFDYKDEVVFLPSRKGILGYDMNGNQKVVMYRLPSSNKTAYCYFEDKKEMLVYDTTNGLILCTTSGFVQSRLLVGNTTLIWMDFLNSENAILMDAKGVFYILDLKTGRSFHCYSIFNSSESGIVTKTHQNKNDRTFSKVGQPSNSFSDSSNGKRMPSRVFLLRKSLEVCMCFGPRLETFKIDIPWSLWAVNISQANSLLRVEKPGEAARVLAFTSNSFIKIFSPKDGKILTDATPKSLSSPTGFFYDRGYLIFYQSKEAPNGARNAVSKKSARNTESKKSTRNESDRNESDRNALVKKVYETQTQERLFVILEDGSVSIFDANQNPCKEIENVEMKANAMTVCYFDHEFCYAISSIRSGEVYLIDTNNIKEIKKKFLVSHDHFCNLLFDPISMCLICVMHRETILFDLQMQKVVSRLPVKGTKLVHLNNGILYYGYENGDIVFARINSEIDPQNKSLSLLYKEPNTAHLSSITGFAFSQSFWVSVSTDQTIRYWDYSNSNFFTINMPCRLFGCEIINGKRDVVVGTDNELMLIEGTTVFNGEIDEVDPIIDNFDHECDEFQKSLFENVLRMKREEERKENEKRIQLEKEKLKQNKQKDEKSKQKHKRLNLNQEELEILHRLDSVEDFSQKVEASNSPEKVKMSEMTDEMKAQMKIEEENRRNKVFEAMLNITDHDRKFKEKALMLSSEKKVQESSKPDDSNSKPNSSHESGEVLQSSRRSKKKSDEDQIEVVKDENNTEVQIASPSSFVKSEENSTNSSSHAPRRKKKRRVIHSREKDDQYEKLNEENEKPNEQAKMPARPSQITTSDNPKETINNYIQDLTENPAKIESHPNRSASQDDNDTFITKSREGSFVSTNESNEIIQLNDSKKQEASSQKPNQPAKEDIPQPQPPAVESTAIKSRKFKSKPKTENIGTSPISTINFDKEKDEHIDQKPSEPKSTKKKKKSLSTTFNFIHKKTQRCQIRKAPTPPQVVRRLYVPKSKGRKRPRSRSMAAAPQPKFEMPLPQFVLDIDAVVSQFGRGKIELLPLVKRIENENIKSQISVPAFSVEPSFNDSLRSNKEPLKSEDSLNDDLEADSGSSFNKSANFNADDSSRVKPLIEQSKKHIFKPIGGSAIKRNKSIGGRTRQFPSGPSRRPLGNYERSVTVVNSSDSKPRMLIPKFKKRFSSVDSNDKPSLHTKENQKK